LLAVALLLFLFLLADRLDPLPPLSGGYSTLITDRHGTPLRAFADSRGVWRYPVTYTEVSPLYLEALLGYEDRWFYYHPGINPFALARAAVQNLWCGCIVSGGSTLTMQVARLIEPHARSIPGKLRQMRRALQLEWHLSKAQILDLYLNLAPFGGTVEGVQAASYAYLGKSARELSRAEAALLAVLPQSPTRIRPDRQPQRSREARDKVLQRLVDLHIWSAEAVEQARIEPVVARSLELPMVAPLLARRLADQAPQGGEVRTTIDLETQQAVESLVRRSITGLAPRSSVAILVVENATRQVRAYVGSADLFDSSRAGYVDMVRAVRSPGSTLKPFLYALAIEEGLIHSQSLLADVPGLFTEYQPDNFSGGYSGPVSATQALQRSLNIPAVSLLAHYGPERFAARLRNAGLELYLPGDQASLAMVLGGEGVTLEGLVGLYTALANQGLAGSLQYIEGAPPPARRLVSDGAAWIVRHMLAEQARPEHRSALLAVESGRTLAWKTGTSYGYRDAWAIGVNPRYTIGVWVGRPDGTPTPGAYGAVSAAPLLFQLADMLQLGPAPADNMPASVTKADVCWPLGGQESESHGLCTQKHSAWLLDGMAPTTLSPSVEAPWSARPIQYWINPVTGRRVDVGCGPEQREQHAIAPWPPRLEAWLPREQRRLSRLPPWDHACSQAVETFSDPLGLRGVGDQLVLRPAARDGSSPMVTFTPIGGSSELYWLLDGKPLTRTPRGQALNWRFDVEGTHELTVFDTQGRHASVEVLVESASAGE